MGSAYVPICLEAVLLKRYIYARTTDWRDAPMANHLTPTELAREAGLERREVIAKCMEMGVPIFQGRIDKSLFLMNLRHAAQVAEQPAKA
jgi:hypothetical protein